MYKRFLIISAVIASLILGSIAALNIYQDPLFQYRDPFHGEAFEEQDVYYVFSDATYQNPGMAKNFSFDTLITGSSMTENFDSAYFDTLMGTNALKLSLSGGNARNISSLVEVALVHNPELKTVYTSLDWYALSGDYLATGNQPPEYLMNDNYLDDVNYLLNKDITIQYTLTNIGQKMHLNAVTTPKNQINMWYGVAYGREKILSQYFRPEISSAQIAMDCYHTSVDENLDTYWVPLIQENPDVRFNFFIPPYSMLFYDAQFRGGNFDAFVSMYQYASEKLLVYDNVTVYFFSDLTELTGNLWNYKDDVHYHARINDYMTECFAAGSHQLSIENVGETFRNFRDTANSFDYEQYFENPLADITDLSEYLDALDTERYLVAVAVGRGYYEQLTSDERELLQKRSILPFEDESDNYHVAVIDGDNATCGAIQEENPEWRVQLEEREYVFEQILVKDVPLFSIRIDSIEYSQNSAGISFVVYDRMTRRVVDSVAFEGTARTANRLAVWSDLPAYRETLRQTLCGVFGEN